MLYSERLCGNSGRISDLISGPGIRCARGVRSLYAIDASATQAYLFATLPRKLDFADVKPGDLLFVEGTYFKGRKKQQKGNIVYAAWGHCLHDATV